jgi:hypothetical protein
VRLPAADVPRALRGVETAGKTARREEAGQRTRLEELSYGDSCPPVWRKGREINAHCSATFRSMLRGVQYRLPAERRAATGAALFRHGCVDRKEGRS